jgi:hypothetical protein
MNKKRKMIYQIPSPLPALILCNIYLLSFYIYYLGRKKMKKVGGTNI